MKKSEFRNIVAENNNQFGKTIHIGNVYFNQGAIYNPKYNDGQGFSYTGADRLEKTVNYLWNKAKQEGCFTVGEKEYSI